MSSLNMANRLSVLAFLLGAASASIIHLEVPTTANGASIKLTPSFTSFSFEPAFWVDFFGNASNPNNFTFTALDTLYKHGLRPRIRPGGITMDSMVFDPDGGNVVLDTSPIGGIYRTTVGPDFYKSWSNFPPDTQFVSTLNFENDSLPIAVDLAVASVKYQNDKIAYFELGNEANNYADAASRWNDSTEAYIKQWQNWTAEIDLATHNRSLGNWWASSSTTDETAINIRPADVIPDGIDSTGQVAQYSIHSYAFATCDPARAKLATIANILNHTGLVNYADTEIYPSAKAALDAGSEWIIGEFNSIACSGNPNVSDTFAQALWEIDTELIYAVRNASATYLHQGATLVFQSSDQTNSAGANGSPGFSTYDMLYPRTTEKRGAQRALPGFAGVLFLAEVFATNGTQVRALETPAGNDYLSAYALYHNDKPSGLALLNLHPYYANSTENYSVSVNVGSVEGCGEHATLKRLTAPVVDEKDSSNVTWAGQSFPQGEAVGRRVVERVGQDGIVTLRGSEAVLVTFENWSA